jgi:hypothetical protein
MRTNDMRVPQVEQLGRTITTLGGPATIVAITSPDAKQAEVASSLLAKLVGPLNAAI